MSQWPSSKAKRVLAALLKLGWRVKRQSGSHHTLAREGWPDFVFAFHDGEELGPRMLSRISKHTGLESEHLQGMAARDANSVWSDWRRHGAWGRLIRITRPTQE